MTKININFNKNKEDLFTPVYKRLVKAKTRIVINYGSAASSKSFSQHQLELINLLDTKSDTLFIRKYSTDIYDSCYTLLKNIAQEWGITDLFHWTFSNAKRQILNTTTGHRILFKGIDDPEKLKSIVGIRRIIWEEASQGTFEDFLELMRRVRGMQGIQIFLLLNPISENHWIKTRIIDSGAYDDILTVIHSTYKDNQFLTKEDVRELERLKEIDENHYRIYALGEWGIEDKSGKFCYAYDKQKHSVKVTLSDSEMIWLAFDFNRDPITCGIIQDYDNRIRVVEAIKLHDSNIYALCDHIRAKYPGAIFMVTGDATGRNSTALVKDSRNYYTVIQEELQLNDGQIRVPSVNPRIEQNKVLVNALLQNYPVEIDPDNAASLHYDMAYVEVTEENKIKKDNRTDDKQQADSLDWFRYYCNTQHGDFLRIPKVA